MFKKISAARRVKERSQDTIISIGDSSEFSYGRDVTTASEMIFASVNNIHFRCSLRHRLVSNETLWYCDCCHSEDESV
jgi:hypothetical protein